MRIVITDIPGSNAAVIENMRAVLLAADDGSSDRAAPIVAHGSPQRIAQLAAVILVAVRSKMGEDAFEKVIAAARAATVDINDVSDAFRPGAKR